MADQITKGVGNVPNTITEIINGIPKKIQMPLMAPLQIPQPKLPELPPGTFNIPTPEIPPLPPGLDVTGAFKKLDQLGNLVPDIDFIQKFKSLF